MTRDEYIEANWQRFLEPADAHPEPQQFAEARRDRARARAGARWDRDRQPDRRFHAWASGRRGPGMAGWPIVAALLWAVALELDEQLPPTETGEMICRVCSGWGEIIVELDQTIFGSAEFYRRARNRGAAERIRTSRRFRAATRMIVDRCACEHKRKRPHTVQLHRIVETIAAMRSPLVDDWPGQWLVDMDQREADGDRSPLAVWWAQFYAWTRGAEVDEQALADALEQLVRARAEAAEHTRRSAMKVTGGTAVGELDISVDGANPVEITFGVDGANVYQGRRPAADTAVDILEHVRRRLLSEAVLVADLRIDEFGVGQAHISYDLPQLGRGPETLRAVLAAAREAAPAGVYVTAGARNHEVQGHRHTQVIFDDLAPFEFSGPEWPFLDP